MNTKVKTKVGYKPVNRLKDIKKVVNENGLLSSIAFTAMRLHGDYMIELSANGNKIILAPEHKILIKENEKYVWKIADRISRGDKVYMDDGECYDVVSVQVCYSDKLVTMFALVLEGTKSYFANGFCIKG